jgi:hypothetical protein
MVYARFWYGMKKHTLFLTATLLEAAVLTALLCWGGWAAGDRGEENRADETALVRSLSLTDFAIWTEARYTRHPSQADWFTPFQDFPSSLEHFPAGSIISPAQNGRPERPEAGTE